MVVKDLRPLRCWIRMSVFYFVFKRWKKKKIRSAHFIKWAKVKDVRTYWEVFDSSPRSSSAKGSIPCKPGILVVIQVKTFYFLGNKMKKWKIEEKWNKKPQDPTLNWMTTCLKLTSLFFVRVSVSKGRFGVNDLKRNCHLSIQSVCNIKSYYYNMNPFWK